MKLILKGTPDEIALWQSEQAKIVCKDLFLHANQIERRTGGPGSQGSDYRYGGGGRPNDLTKN